MRNFDIKYIRYPTCSSVYSLTNFYTNCYLYIYSYDFRQYVNNFMVSFTVMLIMLFYSILLYKLLLFLRRIDNQVQIPRYCDCNKGPKIGMAWARY